MAQQKIIVVGGGLAGLMTTIKIAEAGHKVQLFSLVPVKRSHSVCAQGGINGAKNTKGEGDSTAEHTDDTIYGGDFLANQPPIKGMCEAAPGVIDLLDRMGVMFNRTAEGLLDFRRFGGTKHHRTAFAGATTGQQLLYALDEQVRRYEAAGLVEKFEFWNFLSAVIDSDGVCCGITALNARSGEVINFKADAVALATGGPGMVFGKSTNSTICTGTAVTAAYKQGAKYGNGEFIQIHPTAIPGTDKLRLMSESARGEGGRVWVPRDGKPWYFLEDWYPAYGNLVPRDIATRSIYKVVYELGLGINNEAMVYLDLTHKEPEELDRKLGGILEIYEKFVGEDPKKVPMRIFPAVHYSMGGIWVDFEQMTSIPGLFAVGECEYQYHGANRLGANSLLSCIYGGMVAGPKMIQYAKNRKKAADDVTSSTFDQEVKRQQDLNKKVSSKSGNENMYDIWKEMGELMTKNVTVVRNNKDLQFTMGKLREYRERFEKSPMPDSGSWMNQSLQFARNMDNMIDLAQLITKGALLRNESRGAHYKPEFPDRDDNNFLKTTIAMYNQKSGEPDISYEAVDISLIKPRPRKYDTDKKKA